MRRIAAPLLAIVVALASLSPASAGAAGHGSARTTFTLEVRGSISADATFWVAFGPLDDRWGLIQLHPAGHDLYQARVALPAGRTAFAYLEGNGVAHSRLGSVPGDPTITIARRGPAPVSGTLPVVRWHAPIG
ncbi:MAG TPA: hypothetical protein VF221_08675 [Chloroflexota bacterium]